MRMTRYVVPVAIAIFAGVSYWMTSGVSSTPRDLRAFRSLQERVRDAAEKAMPAVVAVELPGRFDRQSEGEVSNGFASGVIISTDGLVLSQHHVSHRYFWNGEGAWRNREAGELTTVMLADGREVQAELLGADETHDLSLLQILEPGPFPFVPLEKNGVEVGEWVLEMGHPHGHQRERGAVVRLGRVLRCDKEFLVADCNITGGDSGGPILDLDGRLVGIPCTLFMKEMFSADWRWGRRNWKKPASMSQPVTIVTATSASTFQQCRTDLVEGKLLPFEAKISDIHNQFMEPGPKLPHSDWTQGTKTTGALKQILEPIRPSIVGIVGPDDHYAAMGIVVSADGIIIAIAGTLPQKPKCRLANGDIVDASSIAVDEASGLALLSVSKTNLSPLSLASRQIRLPAGSIVATPAQSNTEDLSACMGIVSVPPTRSRDAVAGSTLRFFESDIPLVPEQIGQPVVDLDGTIVGLVVQTTKYGCKILAIDSVVTRVNLMRIMAGPTIGDHRGVMANASGLANQMMHGSGGGTVSGDGQLAPAAP